MQRLGKRRIGRKKRDENAKRRHTESKWKRAKASDIDGSIYASDGLRSASAATSSMTSKSKYVKPARPGSLLGAPIKSKETHSGTTSDGHPFAVSSMQGWRVNMEDAHIAETDLYAVDSADNDKRVGLPGHTLFALFDGHGGNFAAEYASQNFCRLLACQPKFLEYAGFEQERSEKANTLSNSSERAQYMRSGRALLQDALTDTFILLDKEIACALLETKELEGCDPLTVPPYTHSPKKAKLSKEASSSEAKSEAEDVLDLILKKGDPGAAACVLVVTPEWFVCANAGDCRAVMSIQRKEALALSHDHRPDLKQEADRIRAAGGEVCDNRVEGELAYSRGLGDYSFKNMDVVMAATTSSSAKSDKMPPPQSQPAVKMPRDQMVAPTPEFVVVDREKFQDEFIVLACDGIWDVENSQAVVENVAMFSGLGPDVGPDVGPVCEVVSAAIGSALLFIVPCLFVSSCAFCSCLADT